MRVVVIGRHGQLARSLTERGNQAGVEIVCLARPELDLLHPASVAQAIESAHGDIIINAAAYTGVDKAESEPEVAMRVNGDGALFVAEAAAKAGRPIMQISTDYVFDGALDRPYRENDPARPTSAYGRSKLAGEAAVAGANPRHLIVRTAWVYSPFGQNFVKTMLRLGSTRDEIRVVADQWGAPTSALDLADALLTMARRLIAEPDNQALCGVFHATAPDFTNWRGFADAIFLEATKFGRKPVKTTPIPTSQYPTPATRPFNSRLDTSRVWDVFGVRLPEWRESTRICIERLLADPQPEGL
jgi:dTDP-4-dehydrorhamnose reductase